ncbi:MAG: type VI secretion system tube protein Hcp [Nitrospira sp.]|nr:type VI secretion system tube protein Hcp [Nitrospira sp.]
MATDDYFLKIDGIQGESTDDRHRGEIELDAWSFGRAVSGALQPGGAGAGRFNAPDFHFTAKISQASPMLFLACATGKHMLKATMTGRRAGDRTQDYLKVTLTDVVVSSYQQSGSGGSGVVPLDQVSLNYAKIELEYRRINPDGSLGGPVMVSFDVKKKTGPSRRRRR